VARERGRALLALELDRHDLAREAAFVERFGGATVRFDRERILLFALESVFLRDVLGGDAHVAVAERIVQRADHRIDARAVAQALSPPAGGEEVRPTANAFRTRADRDVDVAEQDVLGCRDDRLQARAAEAVHGEAGRADRKAGFDARYARDVHVARFAVD